MCFGFTILLFFDLATASAILFPVNSLALCTTFLETFILVSNNYFLYLSEKFVANDKSPYPSTYFLLLGSIEYRVISIY